MKSVENIEVQYKKSFSALVFCVGVFFLIKLQALSYRPSGPQVSNIGHIITLSTSRQSTALKVSIENLVDFVC